MRSGSEDDLNLPGLFRAAFHSARERGRQTVTILIPEKRKDEYIFAISSTLYAEQSGIKIFPIPGQIEIDTITISIEPSESIEEGEVIL